MPPQESRWVHVRYDGRSNDIRLDELGLSERSVDAEVFEALARYFDVAPRKFAAYVVERHANGNFTVRPEAVFG
jgi:hypothetical protein